MRIKNRLLLLAISVLVCLAQEASCAEPPLNTGVWVSVFSAKRVLYSKEAVSELIDSCKQAGINEIYLQIYQSGKAYYDSMILDRTRYRQMRDSAKADAIDFLLQEAKKNNIRVFAWLNILSLGQNDQADIIKKFGNEILTRDQHLRPSGRSNPDELDKYYLREDQLFLEPGDPRVVRFVIAVAGEVVRRYPLFSGVHLDYMRYPTTVPFIPSSKFNKFGLSYGYGSKNIERFKLSTGLDPLSGLGREKDFLLWDDWRRQQINILAKSISRHLKGRRPGMLVSCAVIPSAERAYNSMFQDWPLWLEDGSVDYVVLMNYTQDEQLSKEIIRSALGNRQKGRVFVGMGLFLLKDRPSGFIAQYKLIRDLSADGIVFLSYDDLTPEIIAYLKNIELKP